MTTTNLDHTFRSDYLRLKYKQPWQTDKDAEQKQIIVITKDDLIHQLNPECSVFIIDDDGTPMGEHAHVQFKLHPKQHHPYTFINVRQASVSVYDPNVNKINVLQG